MRQACFGQAWKVDGWISEWDWIWPCLIGGRFCDGWRWTRDVVRYAESVCLRTWRVGNVLKMGFGLDFGVVVPEL